MIDHEIVWKFEPGTIFGTVVCHAPQDSLCRLVSDPSECQCGPYPPDVRCNRSGEFSHAAIDPYSGCVVRHHMGRVSNWHCSVKTHLDYNLMDTGTDTFEIRGRTPIEAWWIDRDTCLWRRA